jgi:phage tail sheath protein FI
VRLVAGRTLSRDPRWRQLSVRRLVTMLGIALRRQMQWTVFEPDSPALRDELERMLERYLGGLHAAGALRGRTAEEAFFVRCEERTAGRGGPIEGALVCQVGIAAAEPLEFILLRLTRGGDGTLLVEA